jgi:hypothetical protein
MRRWGLVAAGVATLLLLWAMSPMEDRMQENGPGMVTFELSGGQDRADEILAEWGEDGRDAARDQLWIDYGFMLAYGTFLGLAAAGVRNLCRRRGLRRLAAIGAGAIWLGPSPPPSMPSRTPASFSPSEALERHSPSSRRSSPRSSSPSWRGAIAYLLAGGVGLLSNRLSPASGRLP